MDSLLNLFRFFKFLTIPLRVPLGTVSLLTIGPLAIGVGVTAVTIGTTTVAKFGKSGQRLADPDFAAISSLMFGIVGFLAAVANPFDELANIDTSSYGRSLANSSDFSDDEKQEIRNFIKENFDSPDSDLKKNMEEMQRTIKEAFPDGIPENIKKEFHPTLTIEQLADKVSETGSNSPEETLKKLQEAHNTQDLTKDVTLPDENPLPEEKPGRPLSAVPLDNQRSTEQIPSN